jgi:hypothetical protein
MILDELEETFTVNGTIHNVVCNDAIKGDDRDDQIAHTSDKSPLNYTVSSLS